VNLTVLAPCYYPSVESCKYLARSAEMQAVPIHWYGIGQSYHGWFEVQVSHLLRELEIVTTDHVLYTDGSDTIMVGGMLEIAKRYRRLGSPDLLISSEKDGVNAGGWMGRMEAARKALKVIQSLGDRNPQDSWRQALSERMIEAQIDAKSTIFHVVDQPPMVRDTVMLHFAGGYSDPVSGKAYLMEPIWQTL
jgi:hypothetical protein